MANNVMKSRFMQKCDTTANWQQAHDHGFVPFKGELIIYQDFAEDGTPLAPKFKSGDGTTKVGDLPFSSADTISIAIENSEGENSFKTKDFEDGTTNHALGKSTIALGYGVTAGALSWRITSRSVSEGYTDLYVYDPDHRLGPDCEGMRIGVRFNNNYDYCSVIGSVHGHNDNGEAFITVTPDIPAEALAEGVGIEDTTSDKNTLKIYDLPDAGYINTGTYSFAEGYSAQAQGMISHAEGYNTKAIGKYSHAEGHSAIAAYSAHAEGNRTKAIGWNSHAEGASTQAMGNASHAEGESTIASGQASHAEGNNTQAVEYCTHASGAGTRATEKCQFVQGRFNALDANGSAGNFAHIVGGGNSDSDRKNIYTLDWSGNAVFAGNVKNAAGKTLSTNDFTTDNKNKLDSLPSQGTGDILGQIAFGSSTSAKGKGAFAEGHGTNAGAWASHAEGNGSRTTAGGAHAEGEATQAKGVASHSEGKSTTAEVNYSHAEGEGTIASSFAQHVQGRYNLKDTSYNYNNKPYGTYAHIVGNGTSNNDRSNAYTLDWQGNAWFAGKVTANEVSAPNLEARIDEKMPIAPVDDINLLDENNKINSHYISDTILGQLKFGGTITSIDVSSHIDWHLSPSSLLYARLQEVNPEHEGTWDDLYFHQYNIGTEDENNIVLATWIFNDGNKWTSPVVSDMRYFEGFYFILEVDSPADIDTSLVPAFNVGDWWLFCDNAIQKIDNTDTITHIENADTSLLQINGSSGLELKHFTNNPGEIVVDKGVTIKGDDGCYLSLSSWGIYHDYHGSIIEIRPGEISCSHTITTDELVANKITGTADAAVKDGNGNNIANTYMPKPTEASRVQVYAMDYDGIPMYVGLPLDKTLSGTMRIITSDDTDSNRIYGRSEYTVDDIQHNELVTADMVGDIFELKLTEGSTELAPAFKTIKIGNTELNETQLKKILAFIESIEG